MRWVHSTTLNTIYARLSQNGRSTFRLKNTLPFLGSHCACRDTVPLTDPDVRRDSFRRNLASLSNHEHGEQTRPEQKHLGQFVTIYRFSYIVHLRMLCRLKLFQTGLLLLGLPPMYYLNTVGIVSTPFLCTFLGLSIFSGIILYIMGQYFRRAIGMISVDPSMTSVRVSHLTFWGNRRDIFMDTKDIVPLGDRKVNMNDIYIPFTRYSTKSVLHLFQKHGVLDEEKFLQLIG